MNILAIETSCDESAVTLLEATEKNGQHHFVVHENIVRSQVADHAPYGGVFPNVAKRKHAENLPLMFEQIFKSLPVASSQVPEETQQDIKDFLERIPDVADWVISFAETHEKPDIDYIAVTNGPGLAPALWVGVNVARALARAWDIPLVPVNHMEGHIYSVFADETSFVLPELEFPLLALLISGGHTEFNLVQDGNEGEHGYVRIGATRDDAVGEAYDKVGRLLGLPYPGGPHVSRHASQARTKERDPRAISFPTPMTSENTLDMSFSGLKTAVRRHVDSEDNIDIEQICLSFEDAIVRTLSHKLAQALEETGAKTLVVAGGVAANVFLLDQLRAVAEQFGAKVHTPIRSLATDNSLMIGVAGYIRIWHMIASDAPFPQLCDVVVDANMAIDPNISRTQGACVFTEARKAC